MFHKKTLLTLLVLGLVLTAGIGVTSAFSGKWDGEKPVRDSEKHEAMMEIFENADYDAWVALMNEKPMAEKFADKLTQENFDLIVQMHELKQAGDVEGAKALAEQLGWPHKSGARKFGKFIKNHSFEDKNGDGFCDASDLEITE